MDCVDLVAFFKSENHYCKQYLIEFSFILRFAICLLSKYYDHESVEIPKNLYASPLWFFQKYFFQRERARETERDKDRERETEKERDKERHTERKTETEREGRERRESFVTFNAITNHFVPENVTEISHVVQKIQSFFLQYQLFSSIFLIFDISLLQRN